EWPRGCERHTLGRNEHRPADGRGPAVFVVTCPVCGSPQVALSLVDGDRAVSCSHCEATWEQYGSRQRGIRAGKMRGAARRERGGLAVSPIEDSSGAERRF